MPHGPLYPIGSAPLAAHGLGTAVRGTFIGFWFFSWGPWGLESRGFGSLRSYNVNVVNGYEFGGLWGSRFITGLRIGLELWGFRSFIWLHTKK